MSEEKIDNIIEIYKTLDFIRLMSRLCKTVLHDNPNILENDYIDAVYKNSDIIRHGDIKLTFENIIKQCNTMSELIEKLED